jgi:hypothetical protein
MMSVTPKRSAVSGMICISPKALRSERAFGLKADSVDMTASTSRGSSLYLRASAMTCLTILARAAPATGLRLRAVWLPSAASSVTVAERSTEPFSTTLPFTQSGSTSLVIL